MTAKGDSWEGMVWKSHKYNERVKIKGGTFLNSFCPHCDVELTRDNVLRLVVVNADGTRGKLELSPVLNHYEQSTDIQLPDGQEAKELLCPHCKQSLVAEDRTCDLCSSHVASFQIGSTKTRVPFFICMRKGCHWHAISQENSDQIILDDSDEW